MTKRLPIKQGGAVERFLDLMMEALRKMSPEQQDRVLREGAALLRQRRAKRARRAR